MHLGRALHVAFDLVSQIALGPGDEGDLGRRQLGKHREVGVAQVKDE